MGLGSGLGAMNETSRFIRPVLDFLFPSAAPETLSVLHGYIRKLAHVTEYAILAILARRAFTNLRRPSVAALALVLAVAIIDEVRQSLDANRTGTPLDVMIDLGGGVLGSAAWWIVARRSRKRLTTSNAPHG